jgi:hypothetical protein
MKIAFKNKRSLILEQNCLIARSSVCRKSLEHSQIFIYKKYLSDQNKSIILTFACLERCVDNMFCGTLMTFHYVNSVFWFDLFFSNKIIVSMCRRGSYIPSYFYHIIHHVANADLYPLLVTLTCAELQYICMNCPVITEIQCSQIYSKLN